MLPATYPGSYEGTPWPGGRCGHRNACPVETAPVCLGCLGTDTCRSPSAGHTIRWAMDGLPMVPPHRRNGGWDGFHGDRRQVPCKPDAGRTSVLGRRDSCCRDSGPFGPRTCRRPTGREERSCSPVAGRAQGCLDRWRSMDGPGRWYIQRNHCSSEERSITGGR